MHPRQNNATTRQLADAQERAAGNNVHRVTVTDSPLSRHTAQTMPNATLVVTRDGETVAEYTTTQRKAVA